MRRWWLVRSIQVTVATKNRGGAQAGASTTRLYYSDNSSFGTGDVLVATIPVSTINAGLTSSNQVSVTIPTTAATGTRYLIAISDAASTVVEFLETNNRKSQAITIQ